MNPQVKEKQLEIQLLEERVLLLETSAASLTKNRDMLAAEVKAFEGRLAEVDKSNRELEADMGARLAELGRSVKEREQTLSTVSGELTGKQSQVRAVTDQLAALQREGAELEAKVGEQRSLAVCVDVKVCLVDFEGQPCRLWGRAREGPSGAGMMALMALRGIMGGVRAWGIRG